MARRIADSSLFRLGARARTPCLSFILKASWVLFASPVPGSTIHVDDSATGPVHDGSDWCSAHTDLQDALDRARPDDVILVAEGRYLADRGTGDTTISFELRGGIRLVGGFAGCGAPDPDARDPRAFVTVLSGDLEGDDVGDRARRSDNSDTIVRAWSLDAPASVDGFHLSGANAGFFGAAISVRDGNLEVTDCFFSGNVGSGAAALIASGRGDSTVTRCTFSGNLGIQQEGAVFFTNRHSGTMVSCVFRENTGVFGAGLAVAGQARVAVMNGLFARNMATRSGGAVWNINGGLTVLFNCTIFENSAVERGGGVRNELGASGPSATFVINSILWGNRDLAGAGESSQISVGQGTATVDHSCVQGLTGRLGGFGNIGADPLFVEPEGGGDLRLSPGSPCINAGSNAALPAQITSDLDGNARIVDKFIDMGAYELVVVREFRRGDTNADGRLNVTDAVFLLRSLFRRGDAPPCRQSADVNDNGTLEIVDAILLASYLFRGGTSPSEPHSACGPDPTPDRLSCVRFDPCEG